LKNKLRFLLVFAAIHCAATIAAALFVIGSSMALLDSGHSSATLDLKIANGVFMVLAFPLLMPLADAALHAGNPDPINNKIYWLLPPINSIIVASVVTVTWFIILRLKHRGQT
jgi:hypothetical protein